MYRAAVIGLGNIGFQFNLDPKRTETWTHVLAYKRCAETVLVGAAEIDDGKTAVFKQHYDGIPVYGTVGELMENSRAQIVSISTPESSHYQIAREVLQYPVKAIFCEKPLAASVEEAQGLVKMCAEKDVVLAVNHTRRWDSTYLAALNMIEAGRIGDIRVVNALYSGQIFNIGSHLIDIVGMFVRDSISTVSGTSKNINVPDPDISGWIRFDNDILCTILATGKREDLIFEVDVIGEEGRIRVLKNGETTEIYLFAESCRYLGYRELSSIDVECVQKRDRFVEAVYDVISVIEKKKDKVNCSGEDGLIALSACHALARSARNEGTPIRIKTAYSQKKMPECNIQEINNV